MSKIVANQISPRSGDTVTITNKLNIQGVLSYEDVSNIDAVGIVTAQAGLNVTGGSIKFRSTDVTNDGEAGHANIFFGGVGNLYADAAVAADGSISLSNNAYTPPAGSWVYRVADEATNYYQNAGNHVWRYAAAGSSAGDAITWSEAMRIDSSGRLMIGTTTEGYSPSADTLTIASDSSNCGLTIRAPATAYTSIFFSDATSGAAEYAGWIQYYHDNDGFTVGTAQAQKLTLDSSGNLGVTGNVSDGKGDVRDIPQSTNSSQRTLVATDNGKVVHTTTGGWVLPTGVMTQGNTVTLLNGDGVGQTVDASALNALYNTADGANIKANTITLGGASMATVWFGSGTYAYISATNMTVS